MQGAFRRGGVDLSNPDAPIVTSCGSGITAAFLCLGLELCGHRNYRLYDGSWAEWGSEELGLPIVTGMKN
jgi:thiosulfate/3-mercaptopyruvate sulfurtransferase